MAILGGKILKVGRKVRGLTQDEVATIYGIARRTYINWESGKTAISFDDLNTICDHVFKMPLFEVQQVASHA